MPSANPIFLSAIEVQNRAGNGGRGRVFARGRRSIRDTRWPPALPSRWRRPARRARAYRCPGRAARRFPSPCRYSQMACVMARMCHSLNARWSEEPRWPEVPNETRCSGIFGSGRSAKYARDQARNVDQIGCLRGLARRRVNRHGLPPLNSRVTHLERQWSAVPFCSTTVSTASRTASFTASLTASSTLSSSMAASRS